MPQSRRPRELRAWAAMAVWSGGVRGWQDTARGISEWGPSLASPDRGRVGGGDQRELGRRSSSLRGWPAARGGTRTCRRCSTLAASRRSGDLSSMCTCGAGPVAPGARPTMQLLSCNPSTTSKSSTRARRCSGWAHAAAGSPAESREPGMLRGKQQGALQQAGGHACEHQLDGGLDVLERSGTRRCGRGVQARDEFFCLAHRHAVRGELECRACE